MALRQFLRGEIPQPRLRDVAAEVVARRTDGDAQLESVALLEADNWLSTPCVVNGRWFVKVVTAQNSLVHALLTTGRNLGVFASGSAGFFEHFGTPIGMVEHELVATRRMRELGVDAPEPLEAFEHDGYGVLVFEYLPEFEPLDALDAADAEALVPSLFDSLSRMHAAGLIHGDLRSENVLIVDGDPYFIDATKVSEDAIADARAYDIACALAALEPLVGARVPVDAAADSYDDGVLLDAEAFLDFVNIRPDHDFEAATLRGEIEKAIEA